MMDGAGMAGAKSCGEHRKIATRSREISFVIVMNNSRLFNQQGGGSMQCGVEIYSGN